MEKVYEMNEKVDNFAEKHPVAYLLICGLGGLAVTMPLCVLAYKYIGKVQGKAMAKELAAAGVQLGYNHD